MRESEWTKPEVNSQEFNPSQAITTIELGQKILGKTLENQRDLVQKTLDDKLNDAAQLREGNPYKKRVDAYYGFVGYGNKENEESFAVTTKPLNEYLDMSSANILELANNIIKKTRLRDKNTDYSRFSREELIGIERFYEFIKTKDGRQLLHKGIVDTMKLNYPYLGKILSDRLETLDFTWSEGISRETAKNVREIAEFTNSIEKAWDYVNEYVGYIRDILTGHYQQEAKLATKSIDGCRELMTRKGYSSSYNKGQELILQIDQFMRAQQSAYARFRELNKEASAETLNKARK